VETRPFLKLQLTSPDIGSILLKSLISIIPTDEHMQLSKHSIVIEAIALSFVVALARAASVPNELANDAVMPLERRVPETPVAAWNGPLPTITTTSGAPSLSDTYGVRTAPLLGLVALLAF